MRAFILFFIVALCIATTEGQAQTARFFPDAVIIKYENEQTLQKISAEQGILTRQKVNSILSDFGTPHIQPIWKESYSNQLQKSIRTKNSSADAQKLTEDLRQIYRVTFDGSINPEILARKLSSIPGVEYAEPHYLRTTHLVPNDIFSNKYQSYHKFNDAWDITTGSNDVVIAIIDGGVNYFHEDLDAKVWTNPNETPDNGIDDDGNGFIDDIYGWDFWESGLTFATLEEDNEPLGEYSDHGSHVAGIAAAETNNGVGISSTGYDSFYMAVKVGGIEDDPTTNDDESRMIGFGYDGILYATTMGADIINCSFGGPDYSATEQYVITFATDFGALVVASSGNENTDLPSYPASYIDALSVGSVETTNSRASYSNYGYTVDVMATGSSIYSATENKSNTYGRKSGTSMSSPVVSGLAALVKSEHPDWSPRRLATHIRGTSNRLGASYKVGNGAVDAVAALTDSIPGIIISSYEISGVEGEPLKLGGSGTVNFTLKNYGETTSNLTLTISAEQEDIEITTTTTISVGELASEDSTNLSFEFSLPEDFDLTSTPVFIVNFEDDAFDYSDFGPIQVDALDYGIIAANNIRMSFGGNGTIGYGSPSEGTGGIGFLPGDFGNVLFEGGIVMSGKQSLVASTVRNEDGYDRDFDALDIFGVRSPGILATEDGSGAFSSNDSSQLENLDIILNTYAFDEDGIENVVFSQYEISNNSTSNWGHFYFGIFVDWDINDYGNNSIDFDEENNFMYVYDDTEGSNFPYIAIVPMQEVSAHLAMDNAYSGNPTNFQFNLYDGYTDREKRYSLFAGDSVTSVSNTDISELVASGPYILGRDNTIRLGFFYAYGETLEELQSQIAAARAKDPFDVDPLGTYTSLEDEAELPFTTKLNQNYPNPFNPSTELSFDLAETGFTELSVYNINGQKVKTLVNGRMNAGQHAIQFDASTLASGVYLAVLKTNSTTQTIKLTLIK